MLGVYIFNINIKWMTKVAYVFTMLLPHLFLHVAIQELLFNFAVSRSHIIKPSHSSLLAKKYLTCKLAVESILQFDSQINTGSVQHRLHTSFVPFLIFSGTGTSCLACVHLCCCVLTQRNPRPVVSESTDGRCHEKEQSNFKQQRWNSRGGRSRGCRNWWWGLGSGQSKTGHKLPWNMTSDCKLSWRIELTPSNSPRIPVLCPGSASTLQTDTNMLSDSLKRV